MLAADAVPEPARLVKLAEHAVAAQPKSYALLNTLGIACYRAAQFEDAVGRLNEAIQAHGHGGEAWDWLFLALAHQRLGHSPEARQWADKALHWIDQVICENSPGAGGGRTTWEQRFELQLLRSEAARLSQSLGS